MALIKCLECGKEISDKAISCPHCGYLISNSNYVHNNNQDVPVEIKPKKNNNKKRNITIALIVSVVVLLIIVAIIFGSNNNDNSSLNNDFNDTNISICKDGLHQKGSWVLTKEATLVNVGVEEILCTVCGESLDSRGTECKKAKVDGKSFNFKDDEFIDWVNSWDKNFEISGTELGMSNLSPSNTSYAVKLESTGSEGILILNHNDDSNVSGIMAYFEEPIESAAFISYIAKYIEYDFSTDKAGEELIDNKMAYTVGEIVVMRISLDSNFEVTLLAPFEYIGEVLSGASLTKNDCIIYIENDFENYEEYNFNIHSYIKSEYGDEGACWFFHDDGRETSENNDDVETIDDDIGKMMTFRGIVLGESTEDDLITAYGTGNVLIYDEDSDVMYQTLVYHGKEEAKYLSDTKKVILYNYNNSYQIAFYIDNEGIVDFIAYFDGAWY